MASARVGRGLWIIESNIWVAVTTILPRLIHFSIICFWMIGTSSNGTSTPKSPRATMIPSATSKISSTFLTPCILSILAMIFICPPCSSKILRISKISCAVRVNDAAQYSNPISHPKIKSSRSFSEMNGIDKSIFGILTPFLLEMTPPFMTSQTISGPLISNTFKATKPSSIKTVPPGITSCVISL